MSNTAFELRKEFSGKVEIEDADGAKQKVDVFDGAVVGVPPEGLSFDVGEHLKRGRGKIVVDTGHGGLVDVLRALPVLKEVQAPADAKPVSGYAYASAAALLEQAQARGIDGAGGKSKDELVQLLERQDTAIAAGDQDAADNPEAAGGGTTKQEG